MPIADLGCNPEETWADEAQAPARGTEGFAGDSTYILVQGDNVSGLAQGAVVAVENRFRVDMDDYQNKQLAIIAASRLANGDFGWAMIKGVMDVNAARGRTYSPGEVLRVSNGQVTDQTGGGTRPATGIVANATGFSVGGVAKVNCTIYNPIAR